MEIKTHFFLISSKMFKLHQNTKVMNHKSILYSFFSLITDFFSLITENVTIFLFLCYIFYIITENVTIFYNHITFLANRLILLHFLNKTFWMHWIQNWLFVLSTSLFERFFEGGKMYSIFLAIKKIIDIEELKHVSNSNTNTMSRSLKSE